MNKSDYFINKNRAHWDELTEVHVKSKFYNVQSFKNGKSTIHQLEIDEIGNVRGKTLLHFMLVARTYSMVKSY